jgi:chemotaxis protein methyltransferase CheR
LSRYLGPEFDRFIRATLPDLGLDWRRHRRRCVRRKVAGRVRELGLRSLGEYQDLIEADPSELDRFLGLLGVTVSRFFRDRHVFDYMAESVWPAWRGRDRVRMASIGSACGEEPYSLAMLWLTAGPAGPEPIVWAFDFDPACLDRAAAGLYGSGSLKEVPAAVRDRFFTPEPTGWRISPDVRDMVRFQRADVREIQPPRLDLIFCRNLVYTYFDDNQRRRMTDVFLRALTPDGRLVVGAKERPWPDGRLEMEHPCVYRKTN